MPNLVSSPQSTPPVELALPALMAEHGIPRRGAVSALASALGIERQNAANLLRGRLKSIRYSQVGAICRWLLSSVESETERRELRKVLPGALFRYTGPWNRVLLAQRMTVILGERFWDSTAEHEVGWISGADAAVAAELIRALSIGGGSFELDWTILPRHSRRNEHHDDRQVARTAFRRIATKERQVTFLLGSQRVLLVQDDLVGDIWRIEPHRKPLERSAPGIYMMYRSPGEDMPESCFGGCEPPPGMQRGKSGAKPGLHYRNAGAWKRLPWGAEGGHSGVVLLREDPSCDNIVVGLFGYTAACTVQVGRLFCERPHDFQLYAGNEIRSAVYVVRITEGEGEVIPVDIPSRDG